LTSTPLLPHRFWKRSAQKPLRLHLTGPSFPSPQALGNGSWNVPETMPNVAKCLRRSWRRCHHRLQSFLIALQDFSKASHNFQRYLLGFCCFSQLYSVSISPSDPSYLILVSCDGVMAMLRVKP
jgi:hypothetical protein